MGGKKSQQDEERLGLRRWANSWTKGQDCKIRFQDICRAGCAEALPVLPQSSRILLHCPQRGERCFRTPRGKHQVLCWSTRGRKDIAVRGKMAEGLFVGNRELTIIRLNLINMFTVLTSVHFGLGSVLCVSLGSRGLVCEPSILFKDTVSLHKPLLAKFSWICYLDFVNFYLSSACDAQHKRHTRGLVRSIT